jgi:hypothetical protein
MMQAQKILTRSPVQSDDEMRGGTSILKRTVSGY